MSIIPKVVIRYRPVKDSGQFLLMLIVGCLVGCVIGMYLAGIPLLSFR